MFGFRVDLVHGCLGLGVPIPRPLHDDCRRPLATWPVGANAEPSGSVISFHQFRHYNGRSGRQRKTFSRAAHASAPRTCTATALTFGSTVSSTHTATMRPS